MMSYGGLILLSGPQGTKEWHAGESKWLLEDIPFVEWIGKVIMDGGDGRMKV